MIIVMDGTPIAIGLLVKNIQQLVPTKNIIAQSNASRSIRALIRRSLITVLLLAKLSVLSAGEPPCAASLDVLIRRTTLNGIPSSKVRLSVLMERFDKLATRYPGRVVLSSYGKSFEHELIKIRIPSTNKNALKIVVTSGVHGNEVLGPLTSLEFAQSFLNNSELAKNFDITIYPMISPHGLSAGARKVREGVDLNRVFTRESQEPEIRSLIADLGRAHFDLALDLHGGPTKNHFFVIRAGEDNNLASKALQSIPPEHVLESNTKSYPGRSGIPSDPERYEMISKGVASSKLHGTLKAFMVDELGVPYSYTLEYPGQMDQAQALNLNRQLLEGFLIGLLKLEKR